MKNRIPLWFKVIYALLIIVSFYIFTPSNIKEKNKVDDNVTKVTKITYNAVPRDLISGRVIKTFDGKLTGYGPDCTGCSGRTASGQDVTNGNIYYNDSIYGEVRIVAADAKYRMGTILRITVSNVYSQPILAIVLDRGGEIKGNKFDLLFASENSTGSLGKQSNVKFEILRNGW